MSLSKSEEVVNAQAVIPCNICDDNEPGQHYCVECKLTLCNKCAKSHSRVPSTKDHNIILRTQVGDIESYILSCTDHGEPASVHCEKCNIPICIQCVTGNHQGHNMVQLSDIADKKKQSLQSCVNELQRNVLPRLIRRKEQIETGKKRYEQKLNGMTKDIEDEKACLFRAFDRIYTGKLTCLKETTDSDLLVFDGFEKDIQRRIKLCEKRISEYQVVIEKKSRTDVMKFSLRRDELLTMGCDSELPEPPTIVPGLVENVIENAEMLLRSQLAVTKPIKQIVPTIISVFKSPLKGAGSIFITKEGDIWLGGAQEHILTMVDISGKVLRRRSIQNTPNHLAVMNCGDVIIGPLSNLIDCKPVKRLLADGREQNVFYPVSDTIYGVSVTDEQKLLICTCHGKTVRTNADGKNVEQIYKGSGERSTIHAVENSDGSIYITDKKTSSVVVLDKEGSNRKFLKASVHGEKFGRPVGLVLDKLGNVLFADKSNDCIYVIDQKHQTRQLVGRAQGLNRPRHLAIDSKGNLWITHYDGTIKVVKYL